MKKLERDNGKYHITFVNRPGRKYSDARLESLVKELRATASTCFDTLPDYQVMAGTREELADKVLAMAWRKDGRMAGFCSCVVLPVAGVGKVLHLGLTCVRPEDRGAGLTHLLTRKAVSGHLLRHRPLGKVWVSNCAAVLSSLGSVALHFQDVYPSPSRSEGPTITHQRIAQAIDHQYRHKMFVPESSTFDPNTFVFQGSIKETVFAKEGDDPRFFHRQEPINDYYRSLLDFERGDEVLQIGSASTLGAVKHLYRKRFRRPSVETIRPQTQPEPLGIFLDEESFAESFATYPVPQEATATLPAYPYCGE